METIGSPLLWGIFAVVVVAALLVDLVLMRHGGDHKVTFKEAAWWSLGWIALAMAFNAWLWWHVTGTSGSEAGARTALEFLTGYLVEKSLAVDNIFVFLMVFTYFAVPEAQRQRVLVIGILGAIVLRAILIFAGALLLAKFHWILYVFGAFLLLTGYKMMRRRAVTGSGSEPCAQVDAPPSPAHAGLPRYIAERGARRASLVHAAVRRHRIDRHH